MKIKTINNNLEEAIVDEIVIKPRSVRSKYRLIVENVLEYFKDNPDKRITKLTCEFGADADTISKSVRDWKKDDELFSIYRLSFDYR